MELVADIDRERSLDAMRCAYLASNYVAENLTKKSNECRTCVPECHILQRGTGDYSLMTLQIVVRREEQIMLIRLLDNLILSCPGSGPTQHRRVRRSKELVVLSEHTSIPLKGLAHTG
jgi:hypothetical protein